MVVRKVDVVLLIAIPIVATLTTRLIQADLFVSVLMFFGIPSVYLVIRSPSSFGRCSSFALLVSAPLSFFFDTLAALNGSWIIPNSIFHFKFFGVATFEVYLFGLLWAFYASMFYEHFYGDRQQEGSISTRMLYLICLSLLLILYVPFGMSLDYGLLYIHYFYFVAGIIFVVIPLVLFLLSYPIFVKKLFNIAIYFFLVLFLFEVSAITTKQWVFPGSEFLGFVHLFGWPVPVEEVIIWMCFATPSLMSYFIYFWSNNHDLS